MTDTFSSGGDSGFGHPSDPVPPAVDSRRGPDRPTPAGDVSSTLTELESKLRELEQELSSIGTEAPTPADEAPMASDPGPAAAQRATDLSVPSPGRLVDEATQDPPPAVDEPAPSTASGGRLVDEAFEPTAIAAAERSSAAMIAELLSFRERLERVTEELLHDYNQLLANLTDQRARASQAPPAAQAYEPSLAAGAGAPPQPDLDPHELVEFQGRVELGVGPFYDIASLSAFEDRVARLPNVTATAVRRFEASHAVLDLQLSAPVALVAELRGTVEGDFIVRQLSENRLAITFEES